MHEGPTAGEWTPAFPGQRPPFTAGHTASTKHGAWSPRRVDPLAEQLRDELLTADGCPDHLHLPMFAPAVWAWARAEARVDLLAGWLAALDTTRASKAAYATLAALDRAERAAARAREQLGLTPVSAARLDRDRATGGAARVAAWAGLAGLTGKGAALAARDLAALEAGQGDDGE